MRNFNTLTIGSSSCCLVANGFASFFCSFGLGSSSIRFSFSLLCLLWSRWLRGMICSFQVFCYQLAWLIRKNLLLADRRRLPWCLSVSSFGRLRIRRFCSLRISCRFILLRHGRLIKRFIICLSFIGSFKTSFCFIDRRKFGL